MTGPESLKDAIAAALRSRDDTEAVLGVCAACARELPADGTAVTVMTSDVQRQTIYASDDVIAAVERAQYSLGEGPSLVAFQQSRPALVPRTGNPAVLARWPVLMGEIAGLPVQALFCFPMRFGAIDIGVLACYRRVEGPLSDDEVACVLDALELTSLAMLELRGDGPDEFLLGRWLAVDALSRRKVHQATGMLMGRFDVSAESAFARLRAHAYADGRDIELVARDIVERRVRLEPDVR